jgi:hypothetical protein
LTAAIVIIVVIVIVITIIVVIVILIIFITIIVLVINNDIGVRGSRSLFGGFTLSGWGFFGRFSAATPASQDRDHGQG